MGIQRRTAYFTDDGASFDTKQAAEAHEEQQRLEKWLAALAFESEGYPSKLSSDFITLLARRLLRDFLLVPRDKPNPKHR